VSALHGVQSKWPGDLFSQGCQCHRYRLFR
jgi:hypothetical protein